MIQKLGFKPSKADTDLYVRECGDHYEYLATYVDDILIFSKDPMKVIEDLKTQYTLKGVGEPQYYLGGYYHPRQRTLGQARSDDGSECRNLH